MPSFGLMEWRGLAAAGGSADAGAGAAVRALVGIGRIARITLALLLWRI